MMGPTAPRRSGICDRKLTLQHIRSFRGFATMPMTSLYGRWVIRCTMAESQLIESFSTGIRKKKLLRLRHPS